MQQIAMGRVDLQRLEPGFVGAPGGLALPPAQRRDVVAATATVLLRP